MSRYLSENSKIESDDDEFWTFLDDEKSTQTTSTLYHNDIVTIQTATASSIETENSIPQLRELSDNLNSVDHKCKCLKDEKDITSELSSPAAPAEKDISDNEDEQLTGNVHSSLMTKQSHSQQPFVARFIKLSPFKCINPELPRVKIIIVGDSNTGKSCFLNKYIHGCFDYQSQPTVSCNQLP